MSCERARLIALCLLVGCGGGLKADALDSATSETPDTDVPTTGPGPSSGSAATTGTGTGTGSTTTEPPIDGALGLCRPALVEAEARSRFVVDGVRAGERVSLYHGRGRSADTTCFPHLGDLCTDLVDPQVVGEAVAGDTWVAVQADLAGEGAGSAAAFQAFAARGPGGASSASSVVVEATVQAAGDPGIDCTSPEVCESEPDSDADGVFDACDVCEGGDDNLDDDGDRTPNACDVCPYGRDEDDADGDGVADYCDRLDIANPYLEMVLDVGEWGAGHFLIESQLTIDVDYAVSHTCAWLTVDTGSYPQGTGTVPPRGVAVFNVVADAAALTPGSYVCDLTVTTDHPDYPDMGPVAVALEVTGPGVDIHWPPANATNPAGVAIPLELRVTDEGGVGLPDHPVDMVMLTQGSTVSFVESGTTEVHLVTDANGYATGTLYTPDQWRGAIETSITVADPGATWSETRVVSRSWTHLDGRIYFWDTSDGGNILVMPADASSAPELFDGARVDGHCSGCHTASPRAIPTTGNGAVFTQDRSVNPYQEQLIDTVTQEVVAWFEGDSSDNDFSPDASLVTWSNKDIQIYDIATGTSSVVAGADDPNLNELFPTFSGDGSHIAYTVCEGCGSDHSGAVSIKGGTSSIWSVPATGGTPTLLVPSEPETALYYPEYSPDGRWLVFNKSWTNSGGGTPANSYSSSTAELWLLPVDPTGARATGPARRLDRANGPPGSANSWGTWSPDGNFLAFGSNRLGTWDVFITGINNLTGEDSPAVALPGADTQGGQHIPAWSP